MKGGTWMVLAVVVSLTAAQPANCTVPAKSFPALRTLVNNSSLISHRMKSFIVNTLFDESWSLLLTGECINQNNLNTSNDTVQADDADWIAHVNNASAGLSSAQQAVLNSTTAQYLRDFTGRYGAAVARAFVMDAQGVLVGASALTPDLWQGDEHKWIDAFNSCFTGVHISPAQLDLDANDTVQFIGLPMISDQNTAVGVVAWGLRESSLPCSIDGPTLADMKTLVRAKISDNRTQEFVITVLLPYSVSPFLAQAIRNSNNLHTTRSTMLAQDARWRQGFNASNYSDPLFNATIRNPYGDFLRNVTEFYAEDRWIGEVELLDIQGQLVAASERVDGFFRGDEAPFQRVLNNCSGGIDFSALTFDLTDEQWGWRLALPVTDAENKVLGAISWFLGAPGEPSTAVSGFLDIQLLVMKAPNLTSRAREFVLGTLLPYITDDVFTQAVILSNKIGEPLTKTVEHDMVWRAAIANGTQSALEVSILNSSTSDYLRHKLKVIGLGAVYHAYVTDFRGRVVAMDHSADDYYQVFHYYQGDEPGHVGALNGGHGGIFVDLPIIDPETGVLVQLVSLPLLDAHNRVVGAITFVVAENGLQCVGHALLFHEMAVEISELPVPPVLKAWFLHNILPEAYAIEYSTDAENAWIASPSLAELAQRESEWATNTSMRNAFTLTSSGRTLKQFQAEHPPLANAWVRALRGELVGAIIPPEHYWDMNNSDFVHGFGNCSGSVYVPAGDFALHDEPLRFVLSLPAIEFDNKVRGAITFVVEFPPANHLEVIEAFPAVALAFSVISTLAGLAFGVTFFLYRRTNLVRMSSPAFLLLSLLGAVATSWGLYTMVLQPEGASGVCVARTFLVPLGFALFFSPLFMKSYRVYRIFEGTLGAAPPKKFKSAKFRNKFVFIRVGSFVAVQFALSVLGVILPDRPTFHEGLVIDPESLQRTFSPQCTQSTVFLSLTLIYNLGLLVFGAIVSVLGRRYPTAFNESIYLMITINLLASFALIILFGQTLPSIQDVAWLNTLGGHLMLWVGMGLVFGSKVYQIVTGHADDKVTLVMAPTADRKNSSSGSTTPGRQTPNKDGTHSPNDGTRTTKDGTSTPRKPTTLELPTASRSETPTAAAPVMESVMESPRGGPGSVVENELPSTTSP